MTQRAEDPTSAAAQHGRHRADEGIGRAQPAHSGLSPDRRDPSYQQFALHWAVRVSGGIAFEDESSSTSAAAAMDDEASRIVAKRPHLSAAGPLRRNDQDFAPR
jgi:hypothetical protein